jgi:hypothetical protein
VKTPTKWQMAKEKFQNNINKIWWVGGIKPFELKKISRADIFKFRRSEIKPKTHGRDHNRVEELLFLYAKGK